MICYPAVSFQRRALHLQIRSGRRRRGGYSAALIVCCEGSFSRERYPRLAILVNLPECHHETAGSCGTPGGQTSGQSQTPQNLTPPRVPGGTPGGVSLQPVLKASIRGPADFRIGFGLISEVFRATNPRESAGIGRPVWRTTRFDTSQSAMWHSGRSAV
jgi:hypothetical protein